MDNGFIDLSDIESLNRFLARSNDAPIVIFKHSDTCGISARAYGEMQELVERKANSVERQLQNVPVGIVAVQAARDVSNEIETRTGIEHESPQVFVMMNGRVVWSASHRGVNAEAVERAMSNAVSSEQ